MRAVARYSAIFLPSISISNSATRAHFMPRTVFAASATAFSAALAKLSLEEPTISMTFWAMAASSHRTEVYRFPMAEVRSRQMLKPQGTSGLLDRSQPVDTLKVNVRVQNKRLLLNAYPKKHAAYPSVSPLPFKIHHQERQAIEPFQNPSSIPVQR